MASEDPREALRKLYREGLAKVGFATAEVERGLVMLESDRYFGFADVVASLQLEAPAGVREHQVEWVVQHITAQEARVAVTTRGRRDVGGVAARRAEEAAQRDEDLRAAQRRVEELQSLLAEMTPAELDGRVPLRPEIAEALREQAGYEGEFRGASQSRPSWVGRAPAPKRSAAKVRVRESGAGDDSAAAVADLAETFRDLGLSDAAADRAVAGR